MDHFIVIDAQGIGLWRRIRGGIERESSIAASDGMAQGKLRNWLDGARRRCTLVADLADERHAIERLPRTSKADQRQLAARRLAQRFPDTALTRLAPLPACPEDGALAPVLLAALTRPQLLAPWLDVLGEVAMRGRVEIRGLTSVPFLLEGWFRRQRALPAQALLLTPGAGGLRQIFFRQRRIAFSRVIPARSDVLKGCLSTYRDELAQTLAWLSSQRLSDAPPPIVVFASEADLLLLRELAPATSGEIDFIDFARYHDANGCTDALSLALRERRAHAHYDCPQLQRPRQISTVRRAVMAFTLAASAASLGSAASDFISARHLREEIERLAIEQQAQQNELNRLNAEAQREPQSERLPDWLDQAERLARTPGLASEDALRAVAGLLAEAPWARLESLNWERVETDENGAARHARIELEIAFSGEAPPPAIAAERLSARWQRQHGSPMQARVESGVARLWLEATLALPQRETPGVTP